MYPAKFEYRVARTVEEAIELLAGFDGEAKLMAGGHSLVPMMKLRLVQPDLLVDIGRVAGLRGITERDGSVILGALTRHVEIAESQLLRTVCPVLAEAAAAIGDVQVRNRGTIGGSVAHADPGADLPVALRALDATMVAMGPEGARQIAAADFFQDMFTTALREDEVLTEVRVPRLSHGAGSAYRKLPHPASGYVVVSCAAVVLPGADGRCQEARIALGGLRGTPLRAVAAEQMLAGRVLTKEVFAAVEWQLGEAADPLEDLYASADYKLHMATVLAREALMAASQPGG